MNEKQKEIMHEICKVEDYKDYWEGIVIGQRLKYHYLCRYGKFEKSLVEIKRLISKYIANISAPTLDVCYHIKHKNIIVNASKDLLEFNFDRNGSAHQLNMLLNIDSKYSFTLCFNGKFIDLGLFNPYEKYFIVYYLSIRLKEFITENAQKEKEAVEQKRKELIDMFNNI